MDTGSFPAWPPQVGSPSVMKPLPLTLDIDAAMGPPIRVRAAPQAPSARIEARARAATATADLRKGLGATQPPGDLREGLRELVGVGAGPRPPAFVEPTPKREVHTPAPVAEPLARTETRRLITAGSWEHDSIQPGQHFSAHAVDVAVRGGRQRTSRTPSPERDARHGWATPSGRGPTRKGMRPDGLRASHSHASLASMASPGERQPSRSGSFSLRGTPAGLGKGGKLEPLPAAPAPPMQVQTMKRGQNSLPALR